MSSGRWSSLLLLLAMGVVVHSYSTFSFVTTAGRRPTTTGPQSQSQSQQRRTFPFVIVPSPCTPSCGSDGSFCLMANKLVDQDNVSSTSEDISTEQESGQEVNQEEEEWEYEEFETLTDADFYGSEWLVGTLLDSSPNKIVETWVRLTVDGVAVWGDGKRGKWSLDVPSQFLSISKESFGGWTGKQIWAGVVDESYYHVQGTVRGWGPLTPASVLGQWQAKRLGVEGEEAGTAPWFLPPTPDDEEVAEETEQEKMQE